MKCLRNLEETVMRGVRAVAHNLAVALFFLRVRTAEKGVTHTLSVSHKGKAAAVQLIAGRRSGHTESIEAYFRRRSTKAAK